MIGMKKNLLLLAALVLPLAAWPGRAGSVPDGGAATPEAPELPITLRLPVAGEANGRVLVVSRGGKLLHGTDLRDAYHYEVWKGKVLPMPAQAANGLWGYLDRQGAWALPPQFIEAKSFSDDGVARVRSKSGWGFVNDNLNPIVPATLTYAEAMVHGRAVFWQGEKKGYLDDRGKVVIPARLDGAGPFAANGLARFEKGDQWGYIDREGRVVIAPRYSLALEFSDAGRAPAELDDKWGVIDGKGNWLLKPTYRDMDTFQDTGLAAISDERYHVGYIDGQGRQVIPPTSGLARFMAAGRIRLGGEGDSQVRYLDTRGQVAIAGPFEWGSHFNARGLAVARRDGKWGILHKDGRFLVPPRQIEPVTWDETVAGFDPDSGLMPWLARDGAFEWLDAAGRLVFRLEGKPAGKDKTWLGLTDAGGRTVWQDAAFAGTLRARPFFEPSPQDLLQDGRQWTEVVDTAQSLLQARPRPFVGPSGWKLVREPYDQAGDGAEGDAGDGVTRVGAVQVLSKDYVSEEAWGSYYFLDDQRSEQYRKLMQHLKARLAATFGPPDARAGDDYGLGGGDGTERAVWRVGKQVLVLEWTFNYGDGDITNRLVLAAVQHKSSGSP